MSGVERLPPEPERLCPRGGSIVNDDVRGGDEPRERQPARFGLEIEHDRSLAAVERDEEAADAGRDRHHLAVRITVGRLYLDHLGAELGEERAGERACHVLSDLHDAHAFERQAHRSPSPRRAITSCCTSAVPPAIVEPTEAR